MIASLRGQFIGKGKDSAVIEVNGVGFQVIVPRRLLAEWETPGMQVQVHTYLHVRENELTLYGFSTEEELRLFKLLLSVSGVGPKAAISILSELPPEALQQAFVSEDVTAFARVPGIGPKTAKKIIFDLRDKFPVDGLGNIVVARERVWESELIAALLALGYNQNEARSAIVSLPSGELSFEERLRLALRYFAK